MIDAMVDSNVIAKKRNSIVWINEIGIANSIYDYDLIRWNITL